MVADHKDYGQSGLTIRTALVDQLRRFPDKASRPDYLVWGGLRILTADRIPVPKNGRVRGEFIDSKGDTEQGFEIEVKGWIKLADGRKIQRLRTWDDPRLLPVVEYPFHSTDGLLWVWNVYKMRYPSGQIVEEKWTENAGFWVEKISETEHIYHCSHGTATPPDFGCLVFKISISGDR